MLRPRPRPVKKQQEYTTEKTHLLQCACLLSKNNLVHKNVKKVSFGTVSALKFENILHNQQHVLHQLLPDRMQSTNNLRSRKHDCSLTLKHSVTANEFITRMVYKDMY